MSENASDDNGSAGHSMSDVGESISLLTSPERNQIFVTTADKFTWSTFDLRPMTKQEEIGYAR